jgi:hypothetical protein
MKLTIVLDEQLFGADDKWLGWVREQIQRAQN